MKKIYQNPTITIVKVELSHLMVESFNESLGGDGGSGSNALSRYSDYDDWDE